MARISKKEKIENTVARLLGTSSEPDFGVIETQGELSAALNWYNTHKDNKDAVRYLNEYAKKNKLKGKLNTDKNILTTAWLCRLVNRGITVPDNVGSHIEKEINNLFEIDKTPVVSKITTAVIPKPTIQDRLNDKVSEIAGEIEGSIDDYILSNFKTVPSPYSIMQGKVKGAHANKIIDIFKKHRAEFDEVIHGNDEQLIEGYSNFSKVQMKKLVAYCDQIITDALKLSDESKVTRKPRKRKVKTPDQLVAKVQVCDEDETYKLKSEPAKNIIGASSVWVFNVKNRKLGVYHASDSEGLSVKGSSITNFSEIKSKQKMLRKPEEILPEVVKGGKVFLRNALDNLTTKESLLNGRLNRETVIVKVIK